MAFVNGYLMVMAGQSAATKASMLVHLQKLIEDAEAYGRETVCSYHAAGLQHLE